ncbi:MAG: 2-amino-4-hydroxy-6-hydroxymethyldihydropteridine diphosphokinase [Gammaproteobacteria bacterium]|jgi:2-amino-4-hydroxy-6-hydroxymethyldihydropteridine diphosphokinase
MINEVYVGIGSNVDAQHNIKQVLEALAAAFGELVVSPVYQSAAVGFDGDDFLNLVVKFNTRLDVTEVADRFRAIEDALGRDRSQPRFSKRPVDLDILLYGDLQINQKGLQIPRDEILESPFVLKPLCDLAPDLLHPQQKQSYQALWQAMAPHASRLDLIQLD